MTHVSKKRHNTIRHKMTQKDTKRHKKAQKDTKRPKKIETIGCFFSEISFFNHSFTESCSAHYELSVHTSDA